MESCDFTPELPSWNTNLIKDTVINAATLQYRAYVNAPNGPTDAVKVTFHPPNEAELDVTNPFVPHPHNPLDPEDDAFDGDPIHIPPFPKPLTIAQTMKTLLKWNGQELGKCAQVCFKEKVRCSVSVPITSPLYQVLLNIKNRFRGDYFPATCAHAAYGSLDPQRPTMEWASPSLYDINWADWPFEFLYLINSLRRDGFEHFPVGTQFLLKQHDYLLYGSSCLGFDWNLYKTFWLELVVDVARDSNGAPIPIPNTNPVRNFKIPIWRLAPAP